MPYSAIVWLLAASIFINYIDRTNLSIAAPLLRAELHLSGAQYGAIASAFFWTYAFCQLFSGALADRFDVKWILAGGLALWSVATGLTGLVNSFWTLLAARLLLGAGESVAYPSYSRILVEHFPEERRGSPNAAISAGFSLGLSFGMLFGGMLVARTGWRPFFLGLGVFSLLWLIPWLAIMPSTGGRAGLRGPASPAFWQIAGQRHFIGTAIGLFGANYFSYTLVAWLPTFLVEERRFSMDQMAFTGGAIYIVMAIASIAFARLADSRIKAGLSTPGIRRTISAAGLAICAVSVLVAGLSSEPAVTVAFLIGGGFGFGVFSSSHWAATQTLAGPLASGRWTGMENFAGNLAGMIAPTLMGVVLDRTGHYDLAFVVTAAVTTVGAAAWVFVVRDVRPVSWDLPEAPAPH